MRYVLIDETTETPNATPYNTEAEAIAALRKRIAECVADPAHYLDAAYFEDCFGVSNLAGVSDDEVCECLSELMICEEGQKGVWTNFSSADRWSICGRFPQDKPFGNADTRFYATAGRPSGQAVVA